MAAAGTMTPQERMAKAREAKRLKQEQTAAPDPDAAVARLVDEVRGTASPPPRPKPKPYVEPPEGDRDAQVHLEVIKRLQAEQAKADAAAAARKGRGRNIQDEDRGRAPIEAWIERPERPNPLAFVDDDGTNLLKPGYRGRWVRVRESYSQTNPNTFRLRDFKAWGAEEIVKKDGSKLATETLVAVQIPFERDAVRIIDASPSGAFDTAELHNEADRINRQMSRRYHGLQKGVIGLVEGENSSTYESEDILDRD